MRELKIGDTVTYTKADNEKHKGLLKIIDISERKSPSDVTVKNQEGFTFYISRDTAKIMIQPGDIVIDEDGDKMLYIGVQSNGKHVLEYLNNPWHTGEIEQDCGQNYYETLKLWEEPEVIELTLQDVANKFNIDVNKLRIKD